MLESYYSKPKTLDRIRALWLGSSIDQYVRWLGERRAARGSVWQRVRTLVDFDQFARERGVTSVCELPPLVDSFVDDWMSVHGARCTSARIRINLLSIARLPVEQMLRLVLPGFVGRVRTVVRPFHDQAPAYFDYLSSELGLRPLTIGRHRANLHSFETYLSDIGVRDLNALTPRDVSSFLIDRATHIGPGAVQLTGGTLRTFFRYVYRQRITLIDFTRAVTRSRGYKQATLPRAISWPDVERLVDSVDRRDSIGKRDYAMLMLLVSYGLRAREVAALRLDDLDWKQSQLCIPTRKGGHSTIYPLSPTVGSAIIEYLRSARPESGHRQLFLSVVSPFSPVQQSGVSSRVGNLLRAAGISVPHAGSHTLRHTCVQHLVEADVPFKVIGDYVGHRDASSTLVYGKVALHKLRQLVIGAAEDML